jgi:nitroimidazol reductase NimA-like FMN-containing flavoprotein (pyridoxamine 5'-phosphate oxidase superfamily)
MLIHELSESECEQVLRHTTVGRLACARDDQPYIVPVFLYYDAVMNCLYGFSMVGQKIDWMRANPKVCVEVDEISDQFRWTTVLVFGRYEEIGGSVDEGDSRRAYDVFRQRDQWWLPGAAKLSEGIEHVTPVAYRIRIDRLSGRRAARESAMHSR